MTERLSDERLRNMVSNSAEAMLWDDVRAMAAELLTLRAASQAMLETPSDAVIAAVQTEITRRVHAAIMLSGKGLSRLRDSGMPASYF